MLKSSTWIKEQCEQNHLLDPYITHSERKGVISYGLGPYGYDIRLAPEYRQPIAGLTLLDPHDIQPEQFQSLNAERIILLPGHFILGRSLEYFRMPSKVLGLVFGKSTYARCGVLVNVTPLEPQWHGFLTISIANTGPAPVVLYTNQGIGQVIFLESDDLPLFSYKDLQGKYNGQTDITLAKIQQQ